MTRTQKVAGDLQRFGIKAESPGLYSDVVSLYDVTDKLIKGRVEG